MLSTTACSIANNTVKSNEQPIVAWGSSEGIHRLPSGDYQPSRSLSMAGSVGLIRQRFVFRDLDASLAYPQGV
jgi:hypothetical protein